MLNDMHEGDEIFMRCFCEKIGRERDWFAVLDVVEGICGNKMPTRCNRGFYCRSYCSLNIFRAPLCSSSGAQEYYTVVASCGISCCGFQVAGLLQHPANRTHNPQLHTRPAT